MHGSSILQMETLNFYTHGRASGESCSFESDSCAGTQPEDRRSSETIGGKRDAEDSV